MKPSIRKCFGAGVGCLLIWLSGASSPAASAATLQQTIRTAQGKVVKIYGAGGFRQMEAYQSGVLVSAEGHVLTVLSYVLDTDDLTVVLDNGRRLQAEVIGSDPVSELAILKLPIEGERLPHFDLQHSPAVKPGARVLALSNLFGIATGNEPVSAMQGVVSAVAPLEARRGAFHSNYRGTVYVLDVYSNNPGAAGGALVDWQGRLVGLSGNVVSVALSVNSSSPRRTVSSTLSLGCCEPISATASAVDVIFFFPNLVIRSPRSNPATTAGLSGQTLRTVTPADFSPLLGRIGRTPKNACR